MAGGEVSSIHLINTLIPSAAQLNDPQREGAADIAHLLQFLSMGDDSVPSPGLVFGGLFVRGKVGDMRVDIDAGAGAFFDAAAVAPQHPFGIAVVRADTQSPALNDGDGTFPRIDVISIRPFSNLLDVEPVLQKGGGTTPVPIRRGPDFEIVVTEGTPAASPVAPSTPSLHIKLAEVTVPVGLTSSSPGAGGTAQATIRDWRELRNVFESGPFLPRGRTTQVDTWASSITLLELLGVQGAFGNQLVLIGDMDNFWPVYQRAGAGAGDTSEPLYPQMVPGGREYWKRININKTNALIQAGGAGVEDTDWEQSADTGLTVSHLTAVAATLEFEVPIPIDIRALRVTDFDVDFTINDNFNSAADVIFRLRHWNRSGPFMVNLSPTGNPDTTVAGFDTQAETLAPAVLIEDGDGLSLTCTIIFEAVADSASITIHNIGVKVREGSA